MRIYGDIKIAEQDIVCYKMFNVEDIWTDDKPMTLLNEKAIMCPIKNHIWHVGEENEVLHKEGVTYYKVDGIAKDFNDGWFIARKDKMVPIYHMETYPYFYEHKALAVCECVIPAGSEYVEGTAFDGYAWRETFMSNKLTINKIIKTNYA